MEIYITESTKENIENLLQLYDGATFSDFTRDMIKMFIIDKGKTGIITDFPTGEITTVQISFPEEEIKEIRRWKKENGKKSLYLIESAWIHYNINRCKNA